MRTLSLIAIFLFILPSPELHTQVRQNKLFEQSKGKWSLPIPKYKQAIDHNMSLPYSSEGISFLTDSAYSVKAIFEGIVVGVDCYDENSYSLTTKFGDYFIVYCNLTKPVLKKGDYIKPDQIIGTIVKEANATNCEFTLILRKSTKSIPVYKWFKWKNGA